MKNSTRSALRSRARGVTLIELMISLVIGIVVIGAVLISYIASGQTNKRQAAYAEMNENAQIALSILRSDLLLAGYAQATGVLNSSGVKTLSRTFAGQPILGCGLGFVSENTAGVATCNASGTGAPAIQISYEADVTNTTPTSHTPPFPSDCLGNSLGEAPLVSGAITYYVTHNRYYLATGNSGRSELFCASAATNAGAVIPGQALVDNVEAMQIWYGEAGAAGSRQIVRYVAAAPSVTIDWQNIISVRVCLLMRSSEPVLSGEDTELGLDKYLDCNSAEQTSADRHVRRAYFLTTTLRNKMAF